MTYCSSKQNKISWEKLFAKIFIHLSSHVGSVSVFIDSRTEILAYSRDGERRQYTVRTSEIGNDEIGTRAEISPVPLYEN